MGIRTLEYLAVWCTVRLVRVEKKVGKKINEKPQVMYISPHRPDDPQMVANVKLYPLRQTRMLPIVSSIPQ